MKWSLAFVKALAVSALLLAALSGALVTPVSAQPPTATELSLIEAVRLALQHDPNLRLQEASLRFQEGVVQQQRGAFDPTLTGTLAYQFGQIALDDATVETETETRTTLDDSITELETTQADLQSSLDEALAVQADPVNNSTSDVSLQTRLDVLNAIIGTTDDPDTLADLEALRADSIANEVAALESSLTSTTEDLNETLEDRRKLGDVASGLEQYLGTIDLEYAAPRRDGTTWTGFVDFEADGQNFIGKPKATELGGQGIQDFYDATLGIRFDVSLGEGRGRTSTGAAERAAEIDYEASLASLRHLAAQRIVIAAQAYWSLVAAQEREAIFARSFELQERLTEITEALIEADELAPVEAMRAAARRADAAGSLEAARRARHQARLALVDAVGLGARDGVRLPIAVQSFPAHCDLTLLDTVPVVERLQNAVARRDDLAASRRLRESGKVLHEAARVDLAPKMDLQLEFSTNSIDENSNVREGLEHSFGGSWTTGSGAMSFDFEWIPANNADRGALQQAEAAVEILDIRLRELERSIRSQVVLIEESLRGVVEELEAARDATAAYRDVVNAELEKLRHGEGTVQDVILSEEALTFAQLSEVASEEQLWQLLVQLRFTLGQVITFPDGHGPSARSGFLVESDLLSLPGAEAAGAGP